MHCIPVSQIRPEARPGQICDLKSGHPAGKLAGAETDLTKVVRPTGAGIQCIPIRNLAWCTNSTPRILYHICQKFAVIAKKIT